MLSAPSALVRHPTDFWPIEHVKLAKEPVGERDHSDWLFSLVNQCMRRTTKVTKASK